jgi:anaerobic selenocysteine-containing dehydrogenase
MPIKAKDGEKLVRTFCFDCHCKCGIYVHVKDNQITKVEGDPENPISKGTLCCKAFSAQQIHNHPDRLKYPLKRAGKRGEDKWERISWDEAYDILEHEIRRISEQYDPNAFLIPQGTSRGANHFHARFAATYGSGGMGISPTHICLMPNLLPTLHTFGFFNFVDAPDILKGGCCVLWGMNPFTCFAGMTGRQVLEGIRNGSKLIVIDARFTDVAAKADLWLQPKPGSDLALALAITHVIMRDKLYDADFCDKWTYGFDELKESVKDNTPEWAEEITWIPAKKIEAAAHMMCENRPTNFSPSLGASVHDNGIQTGRAIANIMGIVGDLDAPGGNMSNYYWDISMDPRVSLMGPDSVAKIKQLPGLKEKPLLEMAGNAWPHAAWEAMRSPNVPIPIKGILCVASDLTMTYEDAQDVADALSHLEFIAVKDYFMNSMTKWADLVLPSAHWSEREGQFDEDGMSEPCPFIMPNKAVDPPGEAIDDWELFLQLGKRFNPELWPWKDVREMHLFRLKEFYGVEGTWEELSKKPFAAITGGENRVYKKYAQGKERTDGQPGFRTPTGRVELYNQMYADLGYEPLPVWHEPSAWNNEAMMTDYPLLLMTGSRHYAFFHSAWDNIPMQRELQPDPYVELHPDAAAARGISDGDWCEVSAFGDRKIHLKAHVTKAIDARCAMIPRLGWKHACKELGLPGYGYDKANPNMLVPAEPSDLRHGIPPLRSWRCEIKRAEEYNG